MLNMRYDYCMIYYFDSPFGTVSYDWNGKICSHIWLQEHDDRQAEHDDPVSLWLQHWFDGHAAPLPPLIPPATQFQAKMRPALLAIPAGETSTYGEIARQLGTSARAMGQALGANPLPLLIPCHRVVAADGIGGFACGLRWKKKLLQFEANLLTASTA